jgi:hypothetical protein
VTSSSVRRVKGKMEDELIERYAVYLSFKLHQAMTKYAMINNEARLRRDVEAALAMTPGKVVDGKIVFPKGRPRPEQVDLHVAYITAKLSMIRCRWNSHEQVAFGVNLISQVADRIAASIKDELRRRASSS